MTILAIILAALIAIEGLLAATCPVQLKRLLDAAPPRILQLAGALELVLAVAAFVAIAYLSRAGG